MTSRKGTPKPDEHALWYDCETEADERPSLVRKSLWAVALAGLASLAWMLVRPD